MKLSQKARSAAFLGTLCSVSYLAVYIARNVLGAVTPNMTADGISLDYVGVVSAVYLLSYAVGQLVNGTVGNYVKAKYMISLGLLFAGIANLLFVELKGYPNIALIAYGWTGFSLSMIYGPMTRVVAESTELIYATRCSLGYTFASFLGSPLAGILATFLSWERTFNVSSAVLIVMAITSFTFFTVFEKKGIVKSSAREAKEIQVERASIKTLIGRSIVKFSVISMITGIIRTSFVGYLSTYFCEHLKYSEKESASLFSIATFIICFTAFIAVFIYERLKRNMHLCPLLFFTASAVMFLLDSFITNPIINICVLVIAIMASNASATMLWSVYCPSMRDTGLVSGITGFLDFLSYAAAALGSLLIPKIAQAIGWGNMNLVLAGLMVLGAVICLPYFIKKKKLDIVRK